MSAKTNKNPHKEAFDQAKERFRQVGTEGITSTTHQTGETELPKQDPKSNIQVNPDGTVVVGGPNVKTNKPKPNSGVRIFDYGQEDESKKD